MTRSEALAIRRKVKKAQQALKAAMAKARKARKARWMLDRSQTGMPAQVRPTKRKTPKQRGTSRLVTPSAAEQARGTGTRVANVPARTCMALIQSTIIWVLHPRTATWDQPTISVPLKAPCGDAGYMELPWDVPYNGTDAGFAVCAILEILFGPGNLAKSSFANAMRGLTQEAASHLGAIIHALPRFRAVRVRVLADLAGIQALAVEALSQGTLKGAAMMRAAKKSGLVPVSALRRKKVAVYKREFARTPEALRAALHDIIESARPEFERVWGREPIPPCQGSCGQPGCTEPVVDESTIRTALIDGLWS